MTQVRRAKNYFVYLIALVISGLFSWLGKPAPSWAEETTTQRNATVFQQLMQTAQGTVQNRLQKPANSTDNRDVKIKENSGDTRAVFPDNPAGTRAVFPDNPAGTRAVFPDNPAGTRAVFPDTPSSTREVFPDNPAVSREVFPDAPATQVKAFINKAFMVEKDVSATWIGAQQERFNFMVNTIKDKIERGENLNDVELLYYNVMLNNYVEQATNADRTVTH